MAAFAILEREHEGPELFELTGGKSSDMGKPGHYHKKGSDWEDTTVIQPKKK